MKEKFGQAAKSQDSHALLYEVSRAIVSSRSLDEILLLIVGLTAQLMGSKICSLMLLDAKQEKLEIKATQSLSEAYRNKPAIKVGESASGRAVEEGQPVTVRDVKSDPVYTYPAIAKAEGLCSMIAVPLALKGEVIGVLNCYTTEEHEFHLKEIEILVAVANQAAVAVENTRLLEEKAMAVENLETRKQVEKAKRILIEKYDLSESEAYKKMQKESMNRRQSLKEIAEAIILAGKIAQ